MWNLVWNGKTIFSHKSRAKVGWEAMKRNMAVLRSDGEWYYRDGAACIESMEPSGYV